MHRLDEGISTGAVVREHVHGRASGGQEDRVPRLVEVRANRMPALASYLRPWDETEFRPFKLDVMRVEDGLVAEITTFDARLFPAFGLPPTPPTGTG